LGGSGNVTFWLASHLHLEGATLLLEITWEGHKQHVVLGEDWTPAAPGMTPVVLENAGGKAVTFKPYWNSPEYQPGIPPLIPTSNNQHYYAGTWGVAMSAAPPPHVKEIRQWGMLYLGFFQRTTVWPVFFTCAGWQLEAISASDSPIIGRPGILNTTNYADSDIAELCSTPTCSVGSYGFCTGLFYGNPDLKEIPYAKYWDLRDVKDMSNFFFTNVDSAQYSQLSWNAWTGILTACAWSTARAGSGGWWPCDVPAYPVKWTGNNAGPADEPGKWFKIVSGALAPDNTTPNWENMQKLYLYLVLGQTPPPSVPLPSGLLAWPTLHRNYWDISDTPSCAHLGPLPCNDTNCGIGCICKNNACSPDSN